MDTRTGEILDDKAFQQLIDEEKQHFIQMRDEPTPQQAKMCRVGRNDPCPCGSSKKFKLCHYVGGSYVRRKANRRLAASYM